MSEQSMCHPRWGSFECQGCNKVCCMTCDAPREQQAGLEIKSIGGKFCNDCAEEDAKSNGIPLDKMLEFREAHRKRMVSDYEREAS